MTTYILHGGSTRKDSDDNKRFFSETVSNLNSPIKILCVYFACNKDMWLKKFNQDKVNFNHSQKKELIFTIADENVKILVKQIKNTDVIYFRGGETKKLIAVMKNISNLKDLLQDKVVVGSSAGVYMLSKYYANNIEIGEGLGILPIKSIAHYSKKRFDLAKQLNDHKENLKVYKIPEEKFFVIET